MKGKRGPRSDGRRFFDALLWMRRPGGALARFGRYDAVKRRYYRWIENGVFDRIFAAVAIEPDLERVMIIDKMSLQAKTLIR